MRDQYCSFDVLVFVFSLVNCDSFEVMACDRRQQFVHLKPGAPLQHVLASIEPFGAMAVCSPMKCLTIESGLKKYMSIQNNLFAQIS